jgi:hypothetical protein
MAGDTKEEGDVLGMSGEEKIEMDHLGTPIRHNPLSTIIIKKKGRTIGLESHVARQLGYSTTLIST